MGLNFETHNSYRVIRDVLHGIFCKFYYLQLGVFQHENIFKTLHGQLIFKEADVSFKLPFSAVSRRSKSKTSSFVRKTFLKQLPGRKLERLKFRLVSNSCLKQL